jgi:hypothetical protein
MEFRHTFYLFGFGIGKKSLSHMALFGILGSLKIRWNSRIPHP